MTAKERERAIPDRRSAGYCPGFGLPACCDVPDRLSPGGARAGDWAVRVVGLRPGGQVVCSSCYPFADS